MIRPLLFGVLLLQIPNAATPDESSFSRYRRAVQTSGAGQSCVVLDALTFAHAAPFLKDLRLQATDASGAREIPYVLTLSEAQQAESEPARVLNLGIRGHAITFDLAMPNRPYTEVVLDLAGQNFLATASVSGADAPGSREATHLGDFTLFDLTAQHLSRNSSLRLQEASFPYLHVSLSVSAAAGAKAFQPTPQMVHGASVPPSREAQTLFTVAEESAAFEQRRSGHGTETVAHLHLPQRVPIERVAFILARDFHANFSRDVRVSTRTAEAAAGMGDSVTGTIERVKMVSGAREIDDQRLSIPATLGANLQRPAEVDVSVLNGNDTPLPIASVQLEMRQRSLCFQASANQQLTLVYGDDEIAAPVYDFARTYTPSAHSAAARLGPEERNPGWRARPDNRPYTERHPHLLWIALLVMVCSLALAAFRSRHPHTHGHR